MKRFAAEIAAIRKRLKRLNVKARGSLAKTLGEWLSGHPLSPKLAKALAARWREPDDPLEIGEGPAPGPEPQEGQCLKMPADPPEVTPATSPTTTKTGGVDQ